MSENEDEYNEYSNNLIHKKGKLPGFFGWIGIAIQILAIGLIMLFYLIFKYILLVINYFLKYSKANIVYFGKELKQNTLKTLVKYVILLMCMFMLVHIVKAYEPTVNVSHWMFFIAISSPFLLRFYIFEMCLLESSKISKIQSNN